MTSVTTTHPDYNLALDRWTLCRDACAGEQTIKRREATYLPHFIPHDENRYQQYLKRAYYLNVTGRTRNALVGMVFKNDPEIELPESMEFMRSDVDGTGTSIAQRAKEGLKNLLETGRHAFLVDFTGSAAGLDSESERQRNLRPIVVAYHAENLINWRTEVIDGRERLITAVLLEIVNKARNEFSHDRKNQYRVLRLRDGVYTQQLYDESGNAIEDPQTPMMAGGRALDFIPLFITGAEDNLSSIDDTPLYDLSVVNVGHYRNVADLEEAAYITGQPTLHIDLGETGTNTFEAANPGGIILGSRRAVVTQGGKMELVQPEERSMLMKLKQDKELEMIRLGARLVERDQQVMTAEASRINAAGDSSVLDSLVDNLTTSMGDALRVAGEFMGVNNGVGFELNRNFWEDKLDPQAAMAVIQFGDAGVIARSDQRDMIRRGRLELRADRTDEDIEADIADGAL